MRVSIKAKTILGIALIEASLLTLLIVSGLRYFRSYATESLQSQANQLASLFVQASTDAVISYDLATLESLIGALDEQVSRIRIITPTGQVLAASPGFSTQPFVSDQTFAASEGEYRLAVPITAAGRTYAIAEIGLDVSALAQTLRHARQGASTIAVIEIALVALFSLLLGTYLTRQLSQLASAASAIKAGDYGVRIGQTRDDEIGDVANAFNQMAKHLAQAKQQNEAFQKRLVQANEQLEQRVQRRTQSLEQANQALTEQTQTLKHAQQSLISQEALASVGTLAAGVAHEINTPLGFVFANHGALEGYLDELVAGSPEALEEVRTILADNATGLARIQAIIKSLQTFVHQGETKLEDVHLAQVVDQALMMVKHRTAAAIVIDNQVSEQAVVRADKAQLVQVVSNLVVNAAQALGEQGQITLQTDDQQDCWCLHVIDNGPGIDPDLIDKLFEPFVTTKPVGEGTGLGLSISYGIVTSLGGQLSVRSTLGQGAEFIVQLDKAAANDR